MNRTLKALRLFVLPLTGYCFVLLEFQVMFSFMSQNPTAGRKLTLLNFILPSFISIGFMVWGTIEMFIERKRSKLTKFLLTTLSVLEIISIKWQVEYLSWSLARKNFEESIPIIVAIAMTIFLFAKLIRELKIKNCAQHTV
jgi:hypothetical protein